MQRYSLKFDISVHDPDRLAMAAIEHAAAEGEEAERYKEDPEACLIMLLDPGAGGGACVSNLADLGIEIAHVSCELIDGVVTTTEIQTENAPKGGEISGEGASPKGEAKPYGHIPASFDYDERSSWDVAVYNDHIGLKLVIDRAIGTDGEFAGWRYRLLADNPDSPLAESTEFSEIETALIVEYFHLNLMEVLTPEQWELMLQRNVAYDKGVCASHDFCDANIVMAQTFEFVTGRDPLGETEMASKDIEIWNRAWGIAKSKYLTAKQSLREEEGTRPIGQAG